MTPSNCLPPTLAALPVTAELVSAPGIEDTALR